MHCARRCGIACAVTAVCCFLQCDGTENSNQYFAKEAGANGKSQRLQPEFAIYHDQLQLSSAIQSTVDHSTAISDHEEMELHPSVTAEFVPETFPVQHEMFDDINNTGKLVCLEVHLFH